MKETIETTKWGKIHYIEEKNYRFSLYYYNDDPIDIYLSNVFVDEKLRGNGLGNSLLKVAYDRAKEINPKSTLCLKCLKNSWVCNWYKRHGYTHMSEDDDNNYVWLKKS